MRPVIKTRWSLLVPICGALALTADRAVAQQPGQQFTGIWGGAAVNLVLESRPDGAPVGKIAEVWIDAAGQRKSGTAIISVIPHGDIAELFLAPQSLVTLPFVLRGLPATNHPGLREVEIGAGDQAGVLRPGDDAAYRRLLGGLKPVAVLPSIPKITPPSLSEIEATGLDGEGCQCDAGKTTHIALATESFAQDTTYLLAGLNDYVVAIATTRAALADSRHRGSLPLRAAGEASAQEGYTDRVLAGRRSLDAVDRVLQNAGRQIETGLDAARQSCGQRDLAVDEATTPESRLWQQTCLAVAQADGFFRRQKTAAYDDIFAAENNAAENNAVRDDTVGQGTLPANP